MLFSNLISIHITEYHVFVHKVDKLTFELTDTGHVKFSRSFSFFAQVHGELDRPPLFDNFFWRILLFELFATFSQFLALARIYILYKSLALGLN